MYDPTSLPEITAIDVVTLGSRPDKTDDLPLFCGFTIHNITHILEQRVISRMSVLWRQLPEEEQDRCHIPPYGLRFYQNDTQILECSICWQCNNIWLEPADSGGLYSFDGNSVEAQKLLRLICYLSGDYLKQNPATALSIDDYL